MKVRLLHHDFTIYKRVITTDNRTGNKWICDGFAILYEKEARHKMIYYNQYDKRWANYPYPSKNHPTATIQSAGCGTTAAAMIVANFANKLVTPLMITKFSLENGYRGLEGTSEDLFPAIAKKYNLDYKQTYNLTEMLSAVKKGSLVICLMNSWFRDGTGHYIVAHKVVGKLIKIKDPASTINSLKLYSQSTFISKGNGYFIFTKKPKVDEYVEAIKHLDKIGVADAKYWNSKRKIDKYFPDLIQKFVKYAKKK